MKSRLKKSIEYLLHNKLQIFNDFIVLFFFFAIGVSSFIVDKETLPKGFELPKVEFLQIVFLIVILLSLIYTCVWLLSLKKADFANISKKYVMSNIAILVLMFISIFSTLCSPYSRILRTAGYNTVYNFLLSIFDFLHEGPDIYINSKTALFGNEFRDQGLITYLLLLSALFYVVNLINKNRHWHLIAFSFIIPGLIQALKGLHQFANLYENNIDAIAEGKWVNGYFGQANFYSGFLLMAIIFCAYYLKSKNIILRILSLITIVTLNVTVILTLSYWAIVCLVLAESMVIFYELFGHKYFYYLTWLIGIVFIVSIVPAINIIKSDYSTYRIRADIWQESLNIYILNPTLQNTLIGSGFDTLGEEFRANGKFDGLYVDKGHNFIVDIFTQTGILSLIAFCILCYSGIKNLKPNLADRKYTFAFIAFFIWLIRSFIHETSFINIVQFLAILILLTAINNRNRDRQY